MALPNLPYSAWARDVDALWSNDANWRQAENIPNPPDPAHPHHLKPQPDEVALLNPLVPQSDNSAGNPFRIIDDISTTIAGLQSTEPKIHGKKVVILQIGNGAGPVTMTVTGGITYQYPNGKVVHDSRNGNTIYVTSVGTLVLGGDLDNSGGVIDVANGGTIDFTGANVTGGTLTIGAIATIASGNIVHNANPGGTVNATGSGQTTTITGVKLTDNGVLGATGGATLDLATNVNGSGQIQADGGTILIDNATLGPTSGNVLTLLAVNGGIIETAAGTNGSVLKNKTAIAAGTTLTVVANSSLILQGKISNGGEILVQDPALAGGHLLIRASVALDGGGIIQLGGAAAEILDDGSAATLTVVGNTITGTGGIGNGDGNLTLINGAGGSIIADGGTITINAPMTNHGLLLAQNGGSLELDAAITNGGGSIDASGGTVHVIGALTNGGNLTAENGGTLTIDQLVSNGGHTIAVSGGTVAVTAVGNVDGRINIGGGGAFDLLAGTSNAAVRFTDTAGTLLLGTGNDFSGTVAGLRAGNAMGNSLDLAAVSFAGVSPATESFAQGATSGVLSIGDGIHANSVTLLGQYAANFTEGVPAQHFSGFVLTNDGSGGTLVSYIANAPGPIVA